MGKVSPSTRFRGSALTVLAAGTLFLPVAVVAVGSFGWLEPAGARSVGELPRAGPAPPGAYGASGILPESSELSAAVLVATDQAARVPNGPLDIPPVALLAYRRAAEVLASGSPDCDLRWTVLAGLGRVISDHGDGRLAPDGTTGGPILGPRLNGAPGLAKIPDTDDGRLDGDREWDRAVGPMQLIPTVWKHVGADADGNGTANPHNVHDAALAAGLYLCSGGARLGVDTGEARAIFGYQRSNVFVRAVLAWSRAYGLRTIEPPAPPGPVVALPPVDEVVPLPDEPPPPGPPPSGPPSPPAPLLPPSSEGGGTPTGVGPTPDPRTRPPTTEPPTTEPPTTEPPTTEPPTTEPPTTEPEEESTEPEEESTEPEEESTEPEEESTEPEQEESTEPEQEESTDTGVTQPQMAEG